VFDLAFWTPRGTFGGHITLLLSASASFYWTSVLEEGRPLVTVVEPDVALPASGRSLEVRAQGLWADHNCETPFEHWSYGLEAFAVRLDRPEDALDDGRGERVGLGYDLEWEAPSGQSPSRPSAVLDGGEGYRQAGRVHGEILIGADTYELEASGVRSHWWGTRSWPPDPDTADPDTADPHTAEPEAAEPEDGEEVVGRSLARVPGDGALERQLVRRSGSPALTTRRLHGA
jgi:hypothetical protein